MTAVFYDNPETVPVDKLRALAGAMPTRGDTPEGLTCHDVPAGCMAVLTFKGHYAGLPAAYQDFYGRWVTQSGEEPADVPSFETYLNDPRNTAPEDLLTEICMPLKG